MITSNKLIKSKKQQKALDFALEQIKKSPLAKHIECVYLYGSCARGEERFDSDVDLFIVLKDSYFEQIDELQNYLIALVSDVFDSSDCLNAEVQIVTDSKDWEDIKLPAARFFLYKMIKKEGIIIWQN